MSTLKTNNIQHVDRSEPSILIDTSGSVSIAGTLTYEDVTNVDSVGIITARSGINATGGNITLGDSSDGSSDDVLKFGASSDLSLFHNGTDSRIVNTTGDLSIRGNSLKLASTTGEEYVRCTANGSVDLFFDNVVKLNTNSDGYRSNDNVKAQFGNNSDLQIFHDGNNGNSHIKETGSGSLVLNADDLYLQNAAGTENTAVFLEDGAAELYHNGTKKFETTSGGATVTGRLSTDGVFIGDGGNNDTSLSIGANNDLRLYHDGSNSYVLDRGTGGLYQQSNGNGIFLQKSDGEQMANFITDGAVELYYDNGKKFETRSDGVKLSQGHFYADDSSRVRLGSSQDLNIYHDGSEAVIGNSTGTFQFLSPNEIRYRATTHHFLAYGNDESMAKFIDDGAVELYHNDSKRISTTTTGLSVTRQNAGEYLNVNANYGSSGDQAIETSGDLTFYTNGSSIAARLDQDGLKFNGDTAAANGLDDYEEGNWTPALEFTGTTNISYSGSYRNAEYVKVGNLVYIRLFVSGTGTGTNTGQLKVTGLPFTPNSGGYGRHACSVQAGGLQLSSGESGCFALIEESVAKIDVYAGSTSGVNVTISAAKWNNSGFYIAGTYHILGY